MPSIVRVVLSGGLIATALFGMSRCVAEPVLQNRIIKLSVDAGAHDRELLRGLSEAEEFDPYLRGTAMLERARTYRRLGRQDQAVSSYELALAGRVDPEVNVEAGLYLLEIGRREEGILKLWRALEFSDEYADGIPRPIVEAFRASRAAEP